MNQVLSTSATGGVVPRVVPTVAIRRGSHDALAAASALSTRRYVLPAWLDRQRSGRAARRVMALCGDPWVIGCRRPFQYGRVQISTFEWRLSIAEELDSGTRP